MSELTVEQALAPPSRRWRARLGSPADLPSAVRLLVGLVPILLVVVVWWLVTTLQGHPRVYPPPTLVFDDLLDILAGKDFAGSKSTYVQMEATLVRLVAAFTLSIVVGTALGIVAGRVRVVFSLIENIVWVCMAVPSIVWVFLFVVALGIGDIVPIAAISALLIPQVLVNVAEGAKSVPGDIMEMSRSYHVATWQRLVGIFLPYLVPYIASSARTSFALAVKLVVVAEVVGLPNGIGFELQYWHERIFLGPIAAWGILMIAIGLVVDYAIFAPLERRATRWKGRPTMELTLGSAE